MASRPTVHLIDASVYIFRAYYSMPGLTAPNGTPMGAAYGFASTLLKYLADVRPTHVGVAFDEGSKSFRNTVEPGYKAQREETPPDLAPQFAICRRACVALGLPAFGSPDFEADDVIATLAKQLLAKGARVVVVSADKDLAQIVREDGRAVFHDLARERTLDADGVRAKFGVAPAQIPDFLGLVGDAVDNLPGVPGVGPKGAAFVLESFGRIEEIPADAGQWPEESRQRLRGAARVAALIDTHRDRALRTRDLATVRADVPAIRADLRELAYRGAYRDTARELFDEYGWERIATRVLQWRSGSAPPS